MRLLLVVNSFASAVTPRVSEEVRRILAAEHDVAMVETEGRGHAVELAQGAAADGCDVVVTLGGDGTLNEAANGLAHSATALTPLPGGSTNVFARTLGWGNNPRRAADRVLAALKAPEGAFRSAGLGRAGDRYFVFNAGLGFDAAVVEQVERRAHLKRTLGHPLFVYASVATWLRHFDRRRAAIDLHTPDAVVPDVFFAICLKSNPYTYLGPRPIDLAPGTGLDTAMTVVAFQTLSLPAVLGALGAALFGRAGPGVAKPGRVAYLPDLTSFSLVGKGPVPCQLDGEFIGRVERLDFAYEPAVLRLVVPAG